MSKCIAVKVFSPDLDAAKHITPLSYGEGRSRFSGEGMGLLLFTFASQSTCVH